MSGSNPNTLSDPIVYVPTVSANSSLSSAFAGLPPATLQAFLTSAQTALAALRTGQLEAVISYGEGTGQKSVTYTRTNEAQLLRHITELKILLGIRPRRGAIPVLF